MHVRRATARAQRHRPPAGRPAGLHPGDYFRSWNSMIQSLVRALKFNPLYWLLVCVPIALILVALEASPVWVMIISGAALAPMAGLIGEATESAGGNPSPRMGGLLNATLGNSAELIITIVAIREGLLELVKASITGSILGNLLLVLGMGMLAGGSRHGIQTFDRRKASG